MEPPEGPALDFKTWTLVVVDALRAMIPTARATRTARLVTLAHGCREATIRDERGHYEVWWEGRVAMSISRRDEFTARTAARTLAAHLDDAWARG